MSRFAPALLLLALVALAACPSSGGAGAGGGAGGGPTRPEPAGKGPHEVWLEVRAKADLEGQPAARHMVDGEPTVFVVFASWCQHCRNELAVLAELRTIEPRVHIIGLNAYEDYAEISDDTKLKSFLAEHAPWLPVVKADESWLPALGGVPKIPSVFVYDGSGQLAQAYRRHEQRPPSLDELLQVTARLLPE